MKIKLLFLLFIFSFLSIAFAQSNDNYSEAKLISGAPKSLDGMKFFSNQKNFSFACIKNSSKDTLYFIIQRINSDSLNFILAYTSNNYLNSYSYMNFSKDENENVHASGNIKSPEGDLLDVNVLYKPDKNSILSMTAIRSVMMAKMPAIEYVTNKAKEIDLSFSIGLRDEFIYMNANLYNYLGGGSSNVAEINLLPINLHIAVGLSFLKIYKIEFRTGIMAVYEDFMGTESGIFLQANLFHSNFYGTAGFDLFSNGGGAHGVMVYSESGGDINFLCLGGGLNTSKHFEIDLIYYFPLNKSFGFNQVNSYPISQRYDKIVNGVIKLGFQYTFIL